MMYSLVLLAQIAATPTAREIAASLRGRCVSRSYLDNTGERDFSAAPPFFDLQAVLTADSPGSGRAIGRGCACS